MWKSARLFPAVLAEIHTDEIVDMGFCNYSALVFCPIFVHLPQQKPSKSSIKPYHHLIGNW